MAIELHHLHPGHDYELSRLKVRIAELEKENQTLAEDVSDKIESITELMELVKKYKSEKADLEEERHWRKCSEELPNDGETVLVLLGRTPKTRGFFLTSRYVAGGWTYGEDPQGCKPTHWLRIPKAPEVK